MKKYGFTLVELLAVIVILAVISIIAVPIIGNVIEDSRKKSFQLTCNEIYKSHEQYEIIEGIGDCTVFEFGNDRIETEIIDEIKYEPISKLNLKGELPKSGQLKICNEKVELIIDNGKYTCVIDEDRNEILNGKLEENDITEPVIETVTLSSTTNSVRVVVSAIEEDGIITKYYYSINGGEFKESTSSEYTFSELDKNVEYEIKVVVENKSELKSKEYIEKITTKGIEAPDIKETSKVPESGYEYATSRTMLITYQSENIGNPEYYFKSSVEATVEEGTIIGICENEDEPGECTESNVTTLVENTWYKTTNQEVLVTYEQEGTLYALISDGKNISGTSTYGVTKIDTSKPEVSANVESIKTERVTVVGVCEDKESEITKYEFSNGTEWINNGTTASYTYTGLDKEKEYTFKVRCTNGSGLTNEGQSKNSTLGITNPSIEETQVTITLGYTWATEKIIGITYTSETIENPEYYFKSDVEATVPSGTVIGACGTGTNPEECTSSSVTTLVADTWYKTNSANPQVTYTRNGTLYALTSDGKNISGTSTYGVSKISTGTPTTPTITGGSTSWSTSAKTISVSTESTETSGIYRYQYYISTSATSQTGGIWNTLGSGVTSISISTNGTRYIFFRAVANNGKASSVSNAETTMIDTETPGATSITYNGGSNTCTWKNNYNLTLSASDNVGIKHYEIDIDSDGNADSTTGSNFIPWNEFNSHTIRFRAVDNAGNKGAWTANQHIHMDTESPTHTNWWWGEVTADVAKLYIQAADNVTLPTPATTYDGHNAGVYCPTSTQSGGYSNWYWFPATWDSSANAYRCDITPSTFGHYGQTYQTYLYIYDHANNGGYYNQTTVGIPATCSYSVGQTWDFSYTDAIQQFTVPCSGTYKLEVWGAQGGSSTGGKGGYSYGNKALTVNTNLYIGVGGAGKYDNAETERSVAGGYNGGGSGHVHYDDPDVNIGASGGGATHIAITNNRGELKNYASYTSEVLIVAGGGGGAGGTSCSGGAGGGTSGESGTITDKSRPAGTGGTQSAVGTTGGEDHSTPIVGGFGLGSGSVVGGGGGYYGGGATSSTFGYASPNGYCGGGGGGSGYIGGVTGGSMSNGQRSGDGYARITLVSY